MKVILLAELKGKGGEGDVVDVARGYYNNYLGPQGLAVLATKGNLKQLEQRKGNIAKREAARSAEAVATQAALAEKGVYIVARIGEEGQLFGSVTNANVAAAIKEQLGIEIDKKDVELKQPIKVAGEYDVVISLYREVKGTVKVTVGPEKVEEEPAAEEPAAEAEATEAAEEVAAE